jgi:hypothetical protein
MMPGEDSIWAKGAGAIVYDWQAEAEIRAKGRSTHLSQEQWKYWPKQRTIGSQFNKLLGQTTR